jgi:invasion protein IalB
VTNWEPRLEEDDRRPQRRRKSGRGAVSLLVGVILVLVVVVAGLVMMFFTGAISTAQPTAQPVTVPTPTLRPAVTQAPAATDTAAPPATGAQPAAEKPVVVKQTTYGDWIYACVKRPSSDAAPICTITQTLSEAKTKAPLFIWRMQQSDKGLVAEWQTRTGVMVDHGIVLDAGNGKPVKIPFQLCTPSGCQAVANLAADFVDTLTKAPKVTATVFPIGSNGILLALSTKGLPEALGALNTP